MLPRTAGFTLIEALVALVLFSLVGSVLLSWTNQSLAALRRVEAATQNQALLRSSLAYLQKLNPMTTPQGSVILPQATLSWQSRLIDGPHDDSDTPFGIGYFQVALYQVDARIQSSRGEQQTLNLRLIGYQQVRGLTNPE